MAEIQTYKTLAHCQVIGHPLTMREAKRRARHNRLARRANFRIEKKLASITRHRFVMPEPQFTILTLSKRRRHAPADGEAHMGKALREVRAAGCA
jgi:hypothetical protein